MISPDFPQRGEFYPQYRGLEYSSGGKTFQEYVVNRPVNFLADADLNQKIVVGLRRRASSIDIWSAHEGNVIGLADPEVLRVAADSGRILLSHDQKTMPRHFTEFLRDRSSPGLVIVPQSVPVGVAIDELLVIGEASTAEEWVNSLLFLPL